MKIFFKDIDSVDQFTMNLKTTPSLQCPHCKRQGQLLSHGFVYKKSHVSKKAVGKRIFCSNRNRKKGCGKTIRLYIAEQAHKLHYDTKHLLTFIIALVARLSIQKAYKVATGTEDSRNAYRWIAKLWAKLTTYRKFLHRLPETIKNKTFSTNRFKILLPTLNRIISQTKSPRQFQLNYQVPFI
jgi:hypothetical protein